MIRFTPSKIALLAKGEWSGRKKSGIWGADIVFTKSDGTNAYSIPSFPLWGCIPYKLVQETFKSLRCLYHPPISSLICSASPKLLCWIPWAPLVITLVFDSLPHPSLVFTFTSRIALVILFILTTSMCPGCFLIQCIQEIQLADTGMH